MSSHTSTPRLTLNDLRRLASSRKLAMLTCYDAAFAATLDAAGVDILLIGDSLGMVVQGHDSTLPVTVADVAYHAACVARGAARPWIVADMPFGSFQVSPEQAFASAVTLMQAGSQMVKIEGGAEMAPTVEFLVVRGIPVCAHIGLTPQHVNVFGGYRVQGREAGAAERLLEAARRLQDAGAAGRRGGDDGDRGGAGTVGAAGGRLGATAHDRHRGERGLQRAGAGAARPARRRGRQAAALREELPSRRRFARNGSGRLRRGCSGGPVPGARARLSGNPGRLTGSEPGSARPAALL
jgi:hypothetical protein